MADYEDQDNQNESPSSTDLLMGMALGFSGGVELTEGRLAELVAEAETGYDVDRLKQARPVGRHRLQALLTSSPGLTAQVHALYSPDPADIPTQGDDWIGDEEHKPRPGEASSG